MWQVIKFCPEVFCTSKEEYKIHLNFFNQKIDIFKHILKNTRFYKSNAFSKKLPNKNERFLFSEPLNATEVRIICTPYIGGAHDR